MEDITITQKYALCMLKEKKNLYSSEIMPYLIISMIVEMMIDDNLEIIDKNKVKLNDKMPVCVYNQKLYAIIKDMKKEEVSIKDIITSICYSFGSKKIKSIVEPLKEEMVKSELIFLKNKKGLFGNKQNIILNDEKFNNVINKLRSQLLQNKTMTDDIILLFSLLNLTKFLKNIITKYEKDILDKKLKELEKTEIAQKVRIAKDVIDEMIVMYAAFITTNS